MKNQDSAHLFRVRRKLLDDLNYFQSLVFQGRSDFLCFMNYLHSALLASGVYVRYDSVMQKWIYC